MLSPRFWNGLGVLLAVAVLIALAAWIFPGFREGLMAVGFVLLLLVILINYLT